jgi:hypothetical protein
MMDLIGRPYRLGADGTDPDGALDCIHLVYEVLSRLGIRTPPFNAAWYDASNRTIARDLLRWGTRISYPAYDGDIAVLLQPSTAFSVTWQTGILYINRHLSQVAWCPIGTLQTYHCFRTKSS